MADDLSVVVEIDGEEVAIPFTREEIAEANRLGYLTEGSKQRMKSRLRRVALEVVTRHAKGKET